MTQALANISPVQIPNIQGVPIDLTSRPTDFWGLLVSQGLTRDPMGGTPFKWAVQHSSTSGAEVFVENQALGSNSKRNLAQASLNPFYLRVPVAVTGHVLDQVAAGGTFEDVAQGELANATRDLFELLESTLLGSTQDRGIASIVDSTGTYAGLAQGTYAAWASAETNVGGALTAAVMEDAEETLLNAPHNTRASVILCGPNMITNYVRTMGPSASSTPTRVQLPASGPFDIGLLRGGPPQFNGVPLVAIRSITNTEMYWLDLTDEGVMWHFIRGLRVEKLAKTNDNEQWVVSLGGALKVKNRRKHLKLYGITA